MTIPKLVQQAALIVFCSVVSVACQADEPKPLPELPLTVEGIEAFADPGDVELLNSMTYFTKTSKEYLYRNSSILEYLQPIYNDEGIVPWLYPGVIVKSRDKIESETWITEHRQSPGSANPIWTRDGRLFYRSFIEVTRSDVDVINQFEELSILGIIDTVESPFDINWISTKLPLRAFHLHAPDIVSASSVCQYPQIQFIRYISSGLNGEFNTAGCSAELETLLVTHSNVENLTVTQLPALGTLNLFGSDIKQLQVDGETLPNLKSILLGEASVPSDMSRVHLPEGLVQLLMLRVTDNDLSQLVLPENLQYLDLPAAQLDDYSF
ncbi:hypothetical protein, partial [Saccharospirillum impatiens]|uniref:hypothetical protein n=1 Tax=Saccharospirillum impatiens TaxID=169438 RepID=UPI000560C5F2